MERDHYHKKLERTNEELERQEWAERALQQLNFMLDRDPKSLQKRADDLYDKYAKLAAALGDQTVVLEEGVEYPRLGRGNIVYQVRTLTQDEAVGFQSVFGFIGADQAGEGIQYPDFKEVFRRRVKVEAADTDPREYDYLVKMFVEVIPRMERSLDWILESVCDPKLNPDLVDTAVMLRNELQSTP